MSGLEDRRKAWRDRQDRLGNQIRSVLFKGLPKPANCAIHLWHVLFILRQLPPGAIRVLDVGCGYGRIAKALAKFKPRLSFQGVEFCEGFARAFQRDLGPCYPGPLQSFQAEESFDVILLVTVLMYLDRGELERECARLWDWLKPGGRLICIEPAVEHRLLFQSITGKKDAKPTGGDVLSFHLSDLIQLFEGLPGARIRKRESMRFVPLLRQSALHHAVAVERT